MTRFRSMSAVFAAFAVAMLAVGALPAQAEAPQETAAELQEPAVTVGGMNVAVDPETGRVRPLTPAEQKKLAAAMQRQFGVKAHSPVLHGDGMISTVVGTDFLSYSVARLTESGSITHRCTADQESALAFLAGEASAAPAAPILATATDREER